jgi:hypothetical protein
MSNQEILEKAIQKAIEGGWLPLGRDPEHPAFISGLTLEEVDKCYILSKGFAKALWGDGTNNIKVNDDGTLSPIDPTKPTKFTTLLDYKDHLQQMVIAEDPIKYLGENL